MSSGTQMIRTIQKTLSKESPKILTGLAAGGVLTTVFAAIHDTKEAMISLDAAAYKNKCQVHELEPLEVIKAIWKDYIPTATSAGITLLCIFGANNIHAKRTAAIASVYSLSEKALREYRENVIKVVGEKKEEKIRDELAQYRLNKNPVKEEDVFITGHGGHLVYDPLSARYFRSDIEHIRQKINDFNEELYSDSGMFQTLNDFYYLLGLEGNELGRNIGWDIEDGKLTIRFSSKIAENGEPCIVMDYSLNPKAF